MEITFFKASFSSLPKDFCSLFPWKGRHVVLSLLDLLWNALLTWRKCLLPVWSWLTKNENKSRAIIWLVKETHVYSVGYNTRKLLGNSWEWDFRLDWALLAPSLPISCLPDPQRAGGVQARDLSTSNSRCLAPQPCRSQEKPWFSSDPAWSICF